MWTLLVAMALAGVPEDLETAADTNLPTALREQAFARLATPDAVDTLTALAKDKDTRPQQKWVAIRALGPVKDDASRVAILQFLAAEDAHARMAALGALGDRGDVTLSGYAAARLADPALLVRAAAAEALGKLKDPSTLPDIERALQDPTNHYRGASLWFRRHLVEAAGNIGTDAAVPLLARALDDADPEVSGAAVKALEKVAGFSYAEGRTADQERAAWKRWAGQ